MVGKSFAPDLALLVKRASATMGRQLAAAISSLLLAIVIARMFGPEGNGQFTLAILMPTLLATFINFGIGPANVYFIARGDLPFPQALRVNLKLWTALAVVGSGVGLLVVAELSAVLFPGVPHLLLFLALLSFPLILLQQLLQSLLQAQQNFRSYNLALLVPPVVTLAIVLVVVPVLGLGLQAALVGFVIGHLLGTVASFIAIQSELSNYGSARANRESDMRNALALVSFGWKAHLSNVLTFVNYKADIFLVNLITSPLNTGIYVAAVHLVERLWLLSTAVSTVLLPKLSQLRGESATGSRLTTLVAKYVLLLSFAAAAVVAGFATPLIKLLFGPEYLAAVVPLIWLLPGIVAGSCARVLANDLAARGRPELNMYVSVLVVIVNVLGNLLLIPVLGLTGAAIATSIAYIGNFLAKLVLFVRFSNVDVRDLLLPTRGDYDLAIAVWKAR